MVRKRNVEAFLRRLWALEATLVKAGFPPMPGWWRSTIERFYRSGKRRLVVRKGRRVFASTCVAPRLATAEMLFGEHPHLPGTPPLVFAFLSVKRDEAAKRLRGIKAILDVLSEPYGERGDTVELTNRPAIFAVVTANHKTAVGDTVGFAWLDEVSRWNDDDLGANPAELVVGSLSPALATLPDAKLFLVSSPLGKDDFHAKAFDRGETDGQCVAFGTTWQINPTLSEAETRALEPDERIWAREYGAQPQDTVTENLFGAVLDQCVDPDRIESPPVPDVYYVGAIDAAFKHDKFAVAVAHRETRDGRTLTILDGVRSWRSPRGESLCVPDTLDDCTAFLREYRAHAYADQYHYATLKELCVQRQVLLLEEPWTSPSKMKRFGMVRAAMTAGTVRLPNLASLLAEFRSIQSVLLPGGAERIEAARGTDDEVHAAVLALSKAMETAPDYELAVNLRPVEPEPGSHAARDRDREERLERRIRRMRRTNDALDGDPADMATIEAEFRQGHWR